MRQLQLKQQNPAQGNSEKNKKKGEGEAKRLHDGGGSGGALLFIHSKRRGLSVLGV